MSNTITHAQHSTGSVREFQAGHVIYWKERDGEHYLITTHVGYWQGSTSGEKRRMSLSALQVARLSSALDGGEDEESIDVVLTQLGELCANDGRLLEHGVVIR